MRNRKALYFEKGRKTRRRRMRGTSVLMAGIGMGILLLLMYLVVMLFILIADTMEYQETKQEGHMVGNAVQESGSDSAGVYDADKQDEYIENTEKQESEYLPQDPAMEQLEQFAKAHDISVNEYPDELLELLVKNKEAEEFVFYYPLKKDTFSKEILMECLNQEDVPLFMQWDSRWGYYEYGSSVMGITGCGPTCLSMVAIHLLQNPELTPIYMADYAQRNGYYVDGIGTAWIFMSQGAKELGLKVQEVPLDENVVMQYLEQGKPVICAMGKGDFTERGHFIVLVGIEDGKIKVNDPNSRERSEELWEFSDIKYQIKNMWVYGVRSSS